MSENLEDFISRAPCRYGGVSYLTGDSPIGESLRCYGEWAENEIESFRRFISSGQTVLDIGANIGTHTLAYAATVGTDGRVVAIEPQPTLFELLRRNVVDNGLSDRVELLQKGLSVRSGTVEIPILDPSQRRNYAGISLLDHAAATAEESVCIELVSVDSLNLPQVDAMKIDTEGMELDVLCGAEETIAKHRPILQLEINNLESGVELLQWLRAHDYATYFMSTAAFNPNNFRGSTVNFFGVAHESALIGVAAERVANHREALVGLSVIDSMDALAENFLFTPRAGDKTAFDRNPERLRFERDQLLSVLHKNAVTGQGDQLKRFGVGTDWYAQLSFGEDQAFAEQWTFRLTVDEMSSHLEFPLGPAFRGFNARLWLFVGPHAVKIKRLVIQYASGPDDSLGDLQQYFEGSFEEILYVFQWEHGIRFKLDSDRIPKRVVVELEYVAFGNNVYKVLHEQRLAEIARLTAMGSSSAKEIASLKNRAAVLVREHERMRQNVISFETVSVTNQKVEERYAELETANAHLKEKNANLENALDGCQEDKKLLAAVYRSTSWRITSPMRWLVERVRR